VSSETYVKGVSTCKVEDPVVGPGLEGSSKRRVFRMCSRLDEQVEAFSMIPALSDA
jgi:transposase-like protein